jgi:hypothetical protein
MPGADVLPKSKTREMDRVLPDMARCWSGSGLVLVWGRPDVAFAKLCSLATYEISDLALGAILHSAFAHPKAPTRLQQSLETPQKS